MEAQGTHASFPEGSYQATEGHAIGGGADQQVALIHGKGCANRAAAALEASREALGSEREATRPRNRLTLAVQACNR